MSHTLIRDVGETVRVLFQEKIEELAAENAIVFKSPGEMPTEVPTTNTLSIFLYQVAPNIHLRNLGYQPVKGDDHSQRFPPMALDLNYIFTPFAPTRETEFIILEKIVGIFHDTGVLKGEVLQGDLASPPPEEGEEAEPGNEIRVVHQPLTIDDLNKLWAIFPNRSFRLSVGYQLSPIYIPSTRTRAVTKPSRIIVDMDNLSE